MANEYYDPSERASKVNALFARIAERYDLINDLQSFGLHRIWKKSVVRLAEPTNGARACDVCCGTGDLAFALARNGARTAGVDFTRAMLAQAEARKSALKQSGVLPDFLQGDAQRLPFRAAEFDIVTVGYGLRNLSDWQSGLRELTRILKPGGRLVVLDFGKPDNGLLRALYFAYLRLFVPILGLVFCGSASAYAYILESLLRYPAQRGVEQEMRRLRLERVEVVNILGGVMSINIGRKPS